MDNKKIFSEGVELLLTTWPVLRKAVDEEWGGDDSRMKLVWLISELTELTYVNEKHYNWDDVELILDDVLRVEFGVEFEDEDTAIIARMLLHMADQCRSGNYHSLIELKEKSQFIHGQLTEQKPNEEDTTSHEENAVDKIKVKTSVIPKLDEEGWQVVSRKHSSK